MSNYVYTGITADAIRLGAACLRREADKITERIAELENDRRNILLQEQALDLLWRSEKPEVEPCGYAGQDYECAQPAGHDGAHGFARRPLS